MTEIHVLLHTRVEGDLDPDRLIRLLPKSVRVVRRLGDHWDDYERALREPCLAVFGESFEASHVFRSKLEVADRSRPGVQVEVVLGDEPALARACRTHMAIRSLKALSPEWQAVGAEWFSNTVGRTSLLGYGALTKAERRAADIQGS